MQLCGYYLGVNSNLGFQTRSLRAARLKRGMHRMLEFLQPYDMWTNQQT